MLRWLPFKQPRALLCYAGLWLPFKHPGVGLPVVAETSFFIGFSQGNEIFCMPHPPAQGERWLTFKQPGCSRATLATI